LGDLLAVGRDHDPVRDLQGGDALQDPHDDRHAGEQPKGFSG
jgi:hypothetical protein